MRMKAAMTRGHDLDGRHVLRPIGSDDSDRPRCRIDERLAVLRRRPFTSCAPLPCDAPLDRGDSEVASTLQPGSATGIPPRSVVSLPALCPRRASVQPYSAEPVEVSSAPRPRKICMQR